MCIRDSWPIDRLRPEQNHIQNLLRSRIQNPPAGAHDEKREVNAAYLLLDNSFGKQYTLSERMMKPASNPNHYTDLARELEEAPDRTWFGNLTRRLQGMVRFR